MYILLLLVLLPILFGLSFAIAEKWEKLRPRLLLTGLLTIVLILGAFLFLRYSIGHATGCAPRCVGANLVGRNLQGLVLNGVNFVEANLSSADLSAAQLIGVDLSGATLIAVNLEEANLQNAFLLGADLTGANLAGANLTGADLRGANLTNANLTGVDLTKTSLRGATLSNTELVGVNLTGARLNAVDLAGAKMNGARLTSSDLSGATLSQADLSGAHMTNSRLNGAWLNLTSLIGADLTNSELAGASLIGSDLASANLTSSSLVGSNLVGTDLKGSNLNGVDLRGSVLNLADINSVAFNLDPTILELNELQRSQLLTDTSFVGVGFNNQTVWPNAAVAAALNSGPATEASATIVTDTIKVGLLHSLSGPLAISELSVRDGILLAIDEINAAGGVLGKQVLPILEDGASNPGLFAAKARQLLEEEGVVALFGCWSSESRKAVLPVLEALNSVLFYPNGYEGFESSPHIFYTGAEPSQQIVPAVAYLLSENDQKILLVGSDEIFTHAAGEIIKAQLADADLQIAGEVFFPLDTADFSQLMAQLQAAPPTAILNMLNGESNVAFFTQLAAAGFTAQTLPVMSLRVAEEEVHTIGAPAMAGQLIASNYFQTGQTPENFAFVTAFKTAYGEDRVTSNPIEAGYAAVYLWKTLVEQAQSTALADLQKVARTGTVEFAAPEGVLRLDGQTQHLYKTARIGVVTATGLIDELFASPEPLKPDPFLTQFPWAADLSARLGQP